MELLTVVTPTYNRSACLKGCYDSLLSQTSKQFVWLIVDDGSTDDTQSVVKNWMEDGRIRIEYLKKENGGKASALNLALDHIQTLYTVCLDSDDTFLQGAVEKALDQLKRIREDSTCCGILALRNAANGNVMGGKSIPKEMAFVTAADVILKLELRTEYICFYKTDVLKQYRFPEYEGEKFVPPSWMMFQITQDYRYKTSWDRFCTCEYIADGLTKNKKKVILKNPKGYSCAKRWSFDLAPTLRLTVKNGIMYDCGCFIAKDSRWLSNTRRKLWAIVLYPLGILTYYLRFHK